MNNEEVVPGQTTIGCDEPRTHRITLAEALLLLQMDTVKISNI